MKNSDERIFNAINPRVRNLAEGEFTAPTADDFDYWLRGMLQERVRANIPDGQDGLPEHPSAQFWQTAADSIKNGTPPDFLIHLFESFAEMAYERDILGFALRAAEIRSNQFAAASNAKLAAEILQEVVRNRNPEDSFREVRKKAYAEIQAKIQATKGAGKQGISDDAITDLLATRNMNFPLRKG